MATYECRALTNLTHMAPGREGWNAHSNDLWHWFKHAMPLITNGMARRRPDIAGLPTVDDYLVLARDICRKVAAGDPAGVVKLREKPRGDLMVRDYLIWFHPFGLMSGLFLVVNDRGDHGELETMFSPTDGRHYFDVQDGELLWGTGTSRH